MAIRSLGLRTDVMLLELGGSTVEPGAGAVIVRTPANPTFWWGNFVLLAEPAALEPEALADFARSFPDSAHVAFGIDGTDGAPGIDATAQELGLEVERITVLTARELRAPARPNADATYRVVRTDDDWEQALRLQLASPEAVDRDETFARRRVHGWRALAEAGHGAWYGAFVDEVMRAGLGVFTDGSGVGRYQAVDTHPDFRRRGLAGTLVQRAGAHAREAFGVTTLVIAAEPDYHAIRIYRAVGFDGTEAQVQLIRRPGARG